MYGIAGIITRDPTTAEEIAGVRTANSSLEHRGPNGAGEFQDQHVLLAMRRLSTIDLTTGWQPLYNEPPKGRLHSAISDLLPDWVKNRPKRGFTPPVRDWHNELLKTYGHSMIDGFLTNQGVLNHAGAQLLTTAKLPFNELAPLSFRALVLEHWCRGMNP
jgi:hypothetical protein